MNDGPSLAAADVGIMIAHGRKCLSSGGSVLILRSHLNLLLTLLDIAKSTTRQISANIAWALAYNVIAVALATGLGNPVGLTITPYVTHPNDVVVEGANGSQTRGRYDDVGVFHVHYGPKSTTARATVAKT